MTMSKSQSHQRTNDNCHISVVVLKKKVEREGELYVNGVWAGLVSGSERRFCSSRGEQYYKRLQGHRDAT